MKFALIGVGRISMNHIAAVMKCRGKLEFVAACDLVESSIAERLEQANCKAKVAHYTDYKKMIAETKPELVTIATDSGSHAKIALYCLEHGCHVIVEKPLAMSMKDAWCLVEAARRNKRVLSACHQNRFNKAVQALREAFEAGRFGKISHIAAHVRWNRDEAYYRQAPWRGRWVSDGGCMMNQCIHNVDLVRWMLGNIEEVFAYTANAQHPYIEAEDLGLALIKGKNGAHALFEGTVNVFPRNLEETLYVFGETGTVKLAGKSVNTIDEWKFADGVDDSAQIKEQASEVPSNVYGFGHRRLYEDVIRAVETQTGPLVDGVEGLKALEVVLAIYKSKKTGLPVKLPLEEFSCMDMKGTFTDESRKVWE